MIAGVWDPGGAAGWRARLGVNVRETPTLVAAGGDGEETADGWWLLDGEMLGTSPGDADGAYAAVVWRGERALLTCDPLGQGSLYLVRRGPALLFSSEIPGLLALLDRTPEPDPDTLRQWLETAQTAPDRTLLRDVERLAAGTQLVLDREPCTQRHRRPATAPGEPAAVRDAIVRAVARRCPEGGRVAVQLSGGLDSTVVASAGARALPPAQQPFAHYSVLFPGLRDQDETDWIAIAARELGAPTVRMSVSGGSIVAGALDWAATHRLPLMAPNWFYQRPLMARIAADGATAVLDGEGGDELFSAARYLLADCVRSGRTRDAWRLLESMPGARTAPLRVRARVFSDFAVRGALPFGLHRRLPHRSASESFEARWGWQRRPGPRWSAHLRSVLTDGVARVGAHDHFRLRAGTFGMRARHPLFDLELAELVLDLPPELAFDPVYSRPVLRRSMEGIAPEAILRRPGKARFEPMVVNLLRGPDLPALRDLLGPRAEVRAFLPAGWDPAALAEPPGANSELISWADRAFRALAVEAWLRELASPGAGEHLRERQGLVLCDAAFDG